MLSRDTGGALAFDNFGRFSSADYIRTVRQCVPAFGWEGQQMLNNSALLR